VEVRHLKYMIEAINTIRVKEMPTFEKFDLANLRKSLTILSVMLPLSGALVGGIQVTLMRSFTISMKMDGGSS